MHSTPPHTTPAPMPTPMPAPDTPGYHYHVIRRAIALIDAAPAPLALADLAAQMGMSAAHFQRIF